MSPPSKFPSQRSHIQRGSVYRARFYCPSKSPVNEPSSRSPNVAPLKRHARFQGLLLHIARSPGKKRCLLIKQSFKVPSRFASLPWSPKGSPMDRDPPFPEPMLYSFVRICQSPQNRSSPTKWGKYIRSPSTRPPHADGKTSEYAVRPRCPNGSFTTAIITPVLRSLQHGTFHLG